MPESTPNRKGRNLPSPERIAATRRQHVLLLGLLVIMVWIPLLDLSLMRDANPIDVMHKLCELADPVSALDVADTVLADAHAALLEDSAFGRSLAKSLYFFWVESGYPDELNECAAFDDEYALADQGIGSVEDALSHLLEFTGSFASKGP